jgi:uncharacterized protein (DUF1778 family)
MARPKASPKPRPQRRVTKDETVPIRMTTEQKKTLAAAAQAAGMGLSTWLLSLGLRAAKDG